MAFIYALTDKFNNIRYIGCTSCSLNKRLKEHLRSKEHTYKQNWIKSLTKKGESPNIVCIEEVSISDIFNREIYWIKHYKQRTSLTNLTDGGEGLLGYKHSNQTKRKISKNTKIALSNNKIREKMSKASLGKIPINRVKVIDNFGTIYKSLQDCADKIGVSVSLISICIKNKIQTRGFSLCKYIEGVDNCVVYIKLDEPKRKISRSDEYKENLRNGNLCVKIKDKNNIVYKSISDAALVTGINRRLIQKYLNGSVNNSRMGFTYAK